MSIRHQCPHCGYRLLSDEEIAGFKTVCSGCRKEIPVPKPRAELKAEGVPFWGNPTTIGAVIGLVALGALGYRFSRPAPAPRPIEEAPREQPTNEPKTIKVPIVDVPVKPVTPTGPDIPDALPTTTPTEEVVEPSTFVKPDDLSGLAAWLKSKPYSLNAATEQGVLNDFRGDEQGIKDELSVRARALGLERFRTPRAQVQFMLWLVEHAELQGSIEQACRVAVAFDLVFAPTNPAVLDTATMQGVVALLERLGAPTADVRAKLVAFRLHVSARRKIPPTVLAAAVRRALEPGYADAGLVEAAILRHPVDEVRPWLKVLKGVAEKQRDEALSLWFGAADNDWNIERLLTHPSKELRVAVAATIAALKGGETSEKVIESLLLAARQGSRPALQQLMSTSVADPVLAKLLVDLYESAPDMQGPVANAVRAHPHRNYDALATMLTSRCQDKKNGFRFLELVLALGDNGSNLLFDLAKNQPFNQQIFAQLRRVPVEQAAWLVERLGQGDGDQKLLAACALVANESPLALKAEPVIVPAFTRLCQAKSQGDANEWVMVAQAMRVLIQKKGDFDFSVRMLALFYVDNKTWNNDQVLSIDALFRDQPEVYKKELARRLGEHKEPALRGMAANALAKIKDVDGLANLADDPDDTVAARAYAAVLALNPQRFETLLIQNLGSKKQPVRLIALKQCPVTLVPRIQKPVQGAIEAVMLAAAKDAPVGQTVITLMLENLPTNEDSCTWVCRTFTAVNEDEYEVLLTNRMLRMASCAELAKPFVSAMLAGLKHRSITKRVRSAYAVMGCLESGMKVSQSDLANLEVALTYCVDREIDPKLKAQLSGPCSGAKARVKSLLKK